MPDLTTLNTVKAWLNVTGNGDDAVLTQLIHQVSQSITAYIGRGDLTKRTYTDTFTGIGNTLRTLRNYPVMSVSSVATGQQTIYPSTDGLAPGFWVDPDDGYPPGKPQQVHLTGYYFQRAISRITYTAGYCILAEPHTASTLVMVAAPNGNWMRDEGVTYATGTALTPAATAPGTGQYALGKQPGQYVFATGDANAAVLISYSYVPATLEQACIEIIGERYRYKERIGQVSKNISGEVISFSQKDMPDYAKSMLMSFHNVVPV